MYKVTLFFLSVAFFCSSSTFSQSIATYNITFTSVWNSIDHGTLPDNAHWSRLVGSNHNSDVTFLEIGQLATQGIEDIAELGDNDIFMNVEVQQAINFGNAEQYINGNSLSSATGSISIVGLEINEAFPLLTLVSMIAPSPDWMIAVNSINLRDGNSWRESISIDLYPYDAGTDSGVSYTASNEDITPHIPISSLTNIEPFNNQKIGTLEITLESILGVEEIENEPVIVYPNPLTTCLNISTRANKLVTETFIYNVLGKQVLRIRNQTNSKLQNINVGTLKKGIYLVKLKFEKEDSILKKIVIH